MSKKVWFPMYSLRYGYPKIIDAITVLNVNLDYILSNYSIDESIDIESRKIWKIYIETFK